MILYHGTNMDIETIDLSLSLNHKDFGKGFYLTPERETACRMATKKARLFGGQAMEKVYNSPLMTALQDEENELYIQSPAYLYELMNRMS